MDFPGYFLIVADFIQWAKSQDIPVGPSRGSGAGSVVAWALTITGIPDAIAREVAQAAAEFVAAEAVVIEFAKSGRRDVKAYAEARSETFRQIGELGKRLKRTE